MSTQAQLARAVGLALLLRLVSGCASDDIDPEPEPEPGFEMSDSSTVATPDAGTTPDASTSFNDASAPTPTPDAALDSGTSPAVGDATTDAAADAAAGDAGPGSAADAAADAAPSADAQADAGDFESVCRGGKVGTDSSRLAAGSMYGSIEYWLPPSNVITRLQTTLYVPEEPTTRGTLFLWPGLQPLRGPDPARIGNGVLQPVLTWGSSCAPRKPADYSSWWISGMYVNVTTSAAGPTGCAGGEAMNVEVGDDLRMDMSLSGNNWTQTVLNQQSGKSVDFSIDLKGQAQNRAIFDIEEVSSTKPTEDVIFTDSILTFASPATTCQPSQRGPNDYFSAPTLSPDGLHCCYGKIVLRSRGVAATSPNQP